MALSPGARLRSIPAFGDGEHTLAPGSLFTVVDTVEPGTAGVQLSTEPVVILEHAYDAPVLRDGAWVADTHTRRVAFPASAVTSNFEPCEES